MSKYVIEFDKEQLLEYDKDTDTYFRTLYKAKGFNALVFDKNGLDKLTPLDKELEEAYQKGKHDAEQDLARAAYEEAYQKGYEVGSHEATTLEYQQGLEEGKKQAKAQAHLDVCHDIERVAHGNYQKGLDDAWVAAKKICTNWMISDQTLAEIFGQCKDIGTIMHENTVQEAINKIQAYEQQKADAEIKVGDWVFNKHVCRTFSAKVTCVEGQKVYMLCDDGSCEFADMTDLEKTNVSNPKIEQLLEILKGEQQKPACITCRNRNALYCDACVNGSQWEPKGNAE